MEEVTLEEQQVEPATFASEEAPALMQEEQPLEAPQTQESPQGEELELETEETPPIDPEALKKEIKAELLEELKNEFELTLKKKEE